MLLERGLAESRVSPVELDFHVDARDAICDFLESGPKPYDMAVCGSRGLKGTLTRMMMGSVGRYLLSYAPCPLLVLPMAVLQGAPATPATPA
jgi:nucleotide-binding universal stress UspA family protein